jgi:hypothetical protein
MVPYRVAMAGFVASLWGCGGDDDGGTTQAEQACLDTAEAVANAAVRCGQDYQTNYDAFVQAVGGCSHIVAIRDIDALYGTCLPSFETTPCSDLIAGNVDPSCRNQLLVSR